MPPSTATVFIVDDDEAVRRSLARLLRSAGIAAETFASAEAYLARPTFAGVGCLVLDVQMPGLTGMDLQTRLTEAGSDFPIVFLTGHGDIPMSVQAMKQGAVDFLIKPVDEDALLAAVRRGLVVHEQQQKVRHEAEAIRGCLATLTPRELEVLRCLLTGALNKQIAAHLGVVEKTVKVHRGQVMYKMGVTSIAELVRRCSLAGVEATPLK